LLQYSRAILFATGKRLETIAPPTSSFRSGIEGLGAVAVLAVVAFHYGITEIKGGVGVRIFFVISGYPITGLLIAELNETRRIDFPRFYGHRTRCAGNLWAQAADSMSGGGQFPRQLMPFESPSIQAVSS